MTNQQALEVFRNMPQPLKRAMTSDESAESLSLIASRHNLRQDAHLALKLLAGDIYLGKCDRWDIEGKIRAATAMPAWKARKVADDLNRWMIFPVANDIDALYGGRGSVSINNTVNVMHANQQAAAQPLTLSFEDACRFVGMGLTLGFFGPVLVGGICFLIFSGP